MRVVYLGNHQPDLPPGVKPWSTETHKAASLELLGHTVTRLQEGAASWPEVIDACRGADVFWWTQTYGLAQAWPLAERLAAVDTLNAMLPTVGSHLDIWWGLDRAAQVPSEAFFRVRHLFTADGDHDPEWQAAGVNHHWLPPGVYAPECVTGTAHPRLAADVAFVGSWRHYGHAEWWPQRQAMLGALRRRYRSRARFWPVRQAVRGQALNDVYASTKVVVGDSCFADRASRYFSDRAFETVGRGGFLAHPHIPALAEMLVDGEHCVYFPAGDHREMLRTIDWWLAHDRERERVRAAGQAHVKANHTYTQRMAEALAVVTGDRAAV